MSLDVLKIHSPYRLPYLNITYGYPWLAIINMSSYSYDIIGTDIHGITMEVILRCRYLMTYKNAISLKFGRNTMSTNYIYHSVSQDSRIVLSSINILLPVYHIANSKRYSVFYGIWIK